MLRAALWSRSSTSPQRGQTCVRTLQRLLDALWTWGPVGQDARTVLARERRRHGYYSLPGACCLEREDGQERTPPRVADARGAGVVPDQVGRLHLLVRDHVILLHEGECRLVVEVLAVSSRHLLAITRRASPWPLHIVV